MSYTVDLLAGSDIIPESKTPVNKVFYVLLAALTLLIVFTMLKGKKRRASNKRKKSKNKEPKYFKHSFY